VTVELECEGRVRLGPIGADTERRLTGFGGEWLEYSPDEGVLVVRHIQPGGSPAQSAVPAELIAILDSIPPAERDAMPGGTLVVKDRSGVVMRLVVERGEIRVQWPREDWDHAVAVEIDAALRGADPFSARVSGKARFRGPEAKAAAVVDFVEAFEGLYPEGEVLLLAGADAHEITFRSANVGPAQLLAHLRDAADPIDSLEADLDVGSFAPHSIDRDFRLSIRAGKVQALRPALWRER
jgi:hypothetical protein